MLSNEIQLNSSETQLNSSETQLNSDELFSMIIKSHPDLEESLKIYKKNSKTIFKEITRTEHIKIILDELSESQKIKQLEEKILDNVEINMMHEIHMAIHYEHNQVIKWFGATGYDIKNCVGYTEMLTEKCNTELLQWSLENNFIGDYDKDSIYNVLENTPEKRIGCLNWWLNSGLEMNYGWKLVRKAAIHGYIDVLDWCYINIEIVPVFESYDHTIFSNKKVVKWIIDKKININELHIVDSVAYYHNDIDIFDKFYSLCLENNTEFKYSSLSIDRASSSTDLPVLNWWLNSGLELRYTQEAIHSAVRNGDVDIVKWWLNSGLELKYDRIEIVGDAIAVGCVELIEFLIDVEIIDFNDIKLHNPRAIDKASYRGQISMLDWLVHNNIVLNYTTNAMDQASMTGQTNVLGWWLKSGLELKYTDYSIFVAFEFGLVNVLEWWLKSGLELKYTCRIFDKVNLNNLIEMFSLWLENGLKLNYTSELMFRLSYNCKFDEIKWMINHNLVICYDETILDGRIYGHDDYEKKLRVIHFWLNYEPKRYPEDNLEHTDCVETNTNHINFVKNTIKKITAV